MFRSMRTSAYSSLVGATITSSLLVLKYRSFGPSKEEADNAVLDRAFRIKFNQSQQRNDLFSFIFCVFGGGLAMIASTPVLPSMSAGLATGCLLHFLTSSAMKKDESWENKKKAWKESFEKMK